MPAWPRFLLTDFSAEDVDIYNGLDDEGFVLRQFEIRQSTSAPLTAASLSECIDARDHGDVYAYSAKFGGVGEGAIGPVLSDELSWRGISESGFETLWVRARAACEARWRDGGREAYERSEWYGRWMPLKGKGEVG